MALTPNVDATYADDAGDASVKLHQQDHDQLHGFAKAGGAAGQVLAKSSATDLDTAWKTLPIFVVPVIGEPRTLTNMAAAEGDSLGTQSRIRLDLTGATQIRLSVSIGGSVGPVGAKLYGQYDAEGTPTAVAGLEVFIDTGKTFSNQVSAWVTLPTAAKVDSVWRVVSSGGDGVADPAVGNIHLHYR